MVHWVQQMCNGIVELESVPDALKLGSVLGMAGTL